MQSITYHPIALLKVGILHSNIHHLEISWTNLQVAFNFKALEGIDFTHLRSLAIIGNLGDITPIVNTIFKYPLPHLESIQLCCEGIKNTFLGSILASCRSLKFLSLHPFPRWGGVIDLEPFISHCRHLQSLYINSLDSTMVFTDQVLTSIAQNCPNLKTITLIYCPNISPTSLKYLLQHTPIESLQINNKSSLRVWSIPQMDEILQNFRLHSLSLHYCHSLTSRTFEQVLSQASPLHSLRLYECSSIEDFNPIFQLPMLQSLNLHNCPYLQDYIFSSSTTILSLRSIKFSCCNTLSDIGILYLIQRCPHLNSAKFKSCSNISGMSIIQLCIGCYELHTLHLHKMDRVSLEHLSTIQHQGTIRVKNLKIFDCALISYMNLIEVVTLFSCLESLKISYCNDSYRRTRFVKVLIRQCPSLKYLFFHDETSPLVPREVMFIVGNLRNLKGLSVLMGDFLSEEHYDTVRRKYRALNPYLDLIIIH